MYYEEVEVYEIGDRVIVLESGKIGTIEHNSGDGNYYIKINGMENLMLYTNEEIDLIED